MPDGRVAYRMSMSLRGWVTEDDELVTVGSDRRPTAIAIRGYTDQGDATEDFTVDGSGIAHWKTAVDSGSAPFGSRRYNTSVFLDGYRLNGDALRQASGLIGMPTGGVTL